MQSFRAQMRSYIRNKVVRSLARRLQSVAVTLLESCRRNKVRRFRAQISPKILNKVDRLFTNRLESILIEVLQNCRRAGATRVDVTSFEADGQTTITITDDGSGIDDFSMLLHLGDSAWDEDVSRVEDAAGMGFFSLLHTGVVVISKGKRANITKEMFLGQSPVEVLPYEGESIMGTRLTFSRSDSLRLVESTLQSIVRFGSTPVSFNGVQLERSDFLKDALHIKEYQGVRIGVTLTARYDHSMCNFHGSVIDLKLDGALRLHHVLVPEEHYDPGHLRVDFDVLETTRIRLQLPDRSSIVEDDQYKALCHEARIALFECLSMQPQHRASYARYSEAHRLGVDLKEASPFLAPFFVASADSDSGSQMFASEVNHEGIATIVNPHECALVSLPDSTDDIHAFTFDVARRLFQSLPLKPVAMNQKYKGYSWYESLPRYESFVLTVDSAVISERSKEELDILTIADSIRLSFELVGGTEKTPFLWDLPFAGFNYPDDFMPQLFAGRSSEWVKSGPSAGDFDLVAAAFHLAYRYDEDSDRDSCDTQESHFDKWVCASIAHTLGGPIGAAEFEIRSALQSWKLTNALNNAAVTEVRLMKDEKGDWGFALGTPQQDAV